MTDPTPSYAQEVVLEAERDGRRPRYHRGAELPNGVIAKPEQCNLDQAAEVNVLPALPQLSTREAPTRLVRPWAQLCRRCWAGSDVLTAADVLRDSQYLATATAADSEVTP